MRGTARSRSSGFISISRYVRGSLEVLKKTLGKKAPENGEHGQTQNSWIGGEKEKRDGWKFLATLGLPAG